MNKNLEDLIFLGRVEEEVTLYGKKWMLRVLDSNEQLIATNESSKYNDTLARVFALKIEILGRSLSSVDGENINDIVEGIELIKKLQPIVTNNLFNEYEKLQKKQEDLLKDPEEIKN